MDEILHVYSMLNKVLFLQSKPKDTNNRASDPALAFPFLATMPTQLALEKCLSNRYTRVISMSLV